MTIPEPMEAENDPKFPILLTAGKHAADHGRTHDHNRHPKAGP